LTILQRAVDGPADLVGLRDLLEEQARMISPPVQRLNDDDDARRLGDLHARRLSTVGGLVVHSIRWPAAWAISVHFGQQVSTACFVRSSAELVVWGERGLNSRT
jgi:hypothetical protein